MTDPVKRLLTWLAVWYDPERDRTQHARVTQAAKHATDATVRADRTIEAYRREQGTRR